jgi:hypothetical protein
MAASFRSEGEPYALNRARRKSGEGYLFACFGLGFGNDFTRIVKALAALRLLTHRCVKLLRTRRRAGTRRRAQFGLTNAITDADVHQYLSFRFTSF